MLSERPVEPAVDDLIQAALAGGLAAPETIRGADEADLRALEARLGWPLPAVYRAFMRRCGRGCGDFHATSRWCIDELADCRDGLEWDLAQAGQPPLPDHELVVLYRSGVLGLTLDLRRREPDPPLWGHFHARGFTRRRHFPTVSRFLRRSITEFHRLPWSPA